MAGSADNFAILFSGGGDPSNNHSRYFNSLKGLYEVLVDQRGLEPENVVILYANAGSGQPEFDQSLNQGDGPERALRLLQEAGVKPVLLDELQSLWARVKSDGKTVNGLSQREFKRAGQLIEAINDLGVVHLVGQGGQGQDGSYFIELDLLIRSDLSFARDRGSTVLSATPEALQAVLIDPAAPGGLLNRVDGNDHTFLWTFDHGGFDGPTIDPKNNWGDRSAGNRATLVPWQSSQIPAQELAGWLTPLLSQSGASTLAFAQCYSGGLVEALEPQLDVLPEAYAMAAANGYEVSNGYAFAEGIELALSHANPLARDLFAQAKASDQYAFTGTYAPNGGDRLPGKEHPWASPGDGGDFSVFAGDSPLHPLEQEGLAVVDDGEWGDTNAANSVQLTLQEDAALDLHQALISAGVIGEAVSISAVRLADHGRLDLDNTQRLHYSPLADFHGTDRIGLQLEDSAGARRLEVELIVEAVNDAPHATDDRVVVARGSSGTRFSVDPLTGFLADFDLDGDDLSIMDYTDPSHGSLEFLGGNRFLYTPDADFKGEDRFFYQISDGTASSVAEVTLDVGGRALNRRDEDGAYTLASPVFDAVTNPIPRRNGNLLSAQSSARWDVVDAARLDERYALLLEGEGRREGRFRVWDATTTGGLIKPRGWWGGDRLERLGYEAIFQRDFDGDGQILATDSTALL